MMVVYAAVLHGSVYVPLAGLLALYVLFQFGTLQPRCSRCGGKGAHRNDCPLRDSDG